MIRLFASGAAVGALLLSAASLSSLTAYADPATGAATAPAAGKAAPDAAGKAGPDADWKARMHANHEAFFAARLAALHAGLQLKPEQESLWTPVETAIRDLAQARGHHHHDAEGADHKGVSSNDELRMRSARLIRMGNAMKGLADAADPFVASLSADQKERLPVLLDHLRPKHVLLRAFGVNDTREARDEGHEGREGHRWHHREAERGNDDDRGGYEHHHGFEHHHDHDRWAEGEHDDRDGGQEWHHHRHHHHQDDENDDEPMHS